MDRRLLLRFGLSYLLTAGGLMLLAFSTVVDVFRDPRLFDTEGSSSNYGDNIASVLFAGILIAWGVSSGLALASRAEPPRRPLAVGGVFLSIFLLVLLHAKLFINTLTLAPESSGTVVRFTAGYFFHTGAGYSFVALYVLFLATVLFLGILVASAGYLLFPERFSRIFGNRATWEATEPLLSVSGLFVVASLAVFLVALAGLASDADRAEAEFEGFLGGSLIGLHYLLAFLIGVLILTVIARVGLINWGTFGPFRPKAILEAHGNIGRIERVLVGIILVIDLLLLAAPPIASPTALSQDPVFGLNSRMLAFFLLLVSIPYLLYALSIVRLRRLLEQGRGPTVWTTPFASASFWMILAQLAGIVLVTVILTALEPEARAAVGGSWSEPLGLLLLYTGIASAVFLAASVRFEVRGGLPTPRLRGPSAPVPFAGFVILGLSTALMLWGAGNTYVATFDEGTKTLIVENRSVWGADVLARFVGALLGGLVLALSLGVLAEASQVRQRLMPHYLLIVVFGVIGTLTVFSVGVWSVGVEGAENAYAGLAFHQYYTLEKSLAAVTLVATLAVLYYSLFRILAPTNRRQRSSVATSD